MPSKNERRQASERIVIGALKIGQHQTDRFQRRLRALAAKKRETQHIESAVNEALANYRKNRKSFVIYGAPQSGKTELIVALAARFLDEGVKIVVVLLNDSLSLLAQNLNRFAAAGYSPSPKLSNALPADGLGGSEWIIFCKKNAKDLPKLLAKLNKSRAKRVIIDDEADFATPNPKVNQKKKTRINELTGRLLTKKAAYIGVTATPARLALNRTHSNLDEHWVEFKSHSKYTGQDHFFPVDDTNVPYRRTLFVSKRDEKIPLRGALFSFMVGVAKLNTEPGAEELGYSFLVHTSGMKKRHKTDRALILEILSVLRNKKHSENRRYLKELVGIARQRCGKDAKRCIDYVLRNLDRNELIVLNSDRDAASPTNSAAMNPVAPFTIVIGGNIVSRGVTFDRLLSMFFSRNVKNRLQQDTYIQRARMFGSRLEILKEFELVMPKKLYQDWHRCFIFHRLSLESRKLNKNAPIWVDGKGVQVAGSASIDRSAVVMDASEMGFGLFEYGGKASELDRLFAEKKGSAVNRLRRLAKIVGDKSLPDYLIRLVKQSRPSGNETIAFHPIQSVSGYADKDKEMSRATIERRRGFLGTKEMERDLYPDAMHHFTIRTNHRNKGRVIYKFSHEDKDRKDRVRVYHVLPKRVRT